MGDIVHSGWDPTDFDVRTWDQCVAAGESLDLAAQRRLVDAVAALRRSAALPAEFVVRVHRTGTGTTWTAEHPLLRTTHRAANPADALVVAGVALHRELQQAYPELVPDDAAPLAPPEESWPALAAAEPTTDTAAALAAAVERLAAARRDADAARRARDDRLLADSEESDPDARDAARRRLREAHRARLADAGVEGTDTGWGTDAFGAPADYGLALPVLVAGIEIRDDWPAYPAALGRRAAPTVPPDGRRWIALDHRHRDPLDGQYLRLVATPLTVSPTAELILRRLAEAAPSGTTVGAHAAYRDLVAAHLPGVSVEEVTGWVGPGGLPFDLSSLPALCDDAPDPAHLGRHLQWVYARMRLWWLNPTPSEW